MKLKQKDIIALVICVIIIGVAIYFSLNLLGSDKKATSTNSTNQPTKLKEDTISGKIDKDTLANIKKFKDFDEAKLDNIGRVDPFAPIN